MIVSTHYVPRTTTRSLRGLAATSSQEPVKLQLTGGVANSYIIDLSNPASTLPSDPAGPCCLRRTGQGTPHVTHREPAECPVRTPRTPRMMKAMPAVDARPGRDARTTLRHPAPLPQ